MFSPPLAMSESSVGIIISPLNAITDKQVHTSYNTGDSFNSYSFSVKILKLGLVEISVIRVAAKSSDVFAAIESGEYRFGMHMFMIYMVLPYKNMTKGYFYHM